MAEGSAWERVFRRISAIMRNAHLNEINDIKVSAALAAELRTIPVWLRRFRRMCDALARAARYDAQKFPGSMPNVESACNHNLA
jgi:hypothetical protein